MQGSPSFAELEKAKKLLEKCQPQGCDFQIQERTVPRRSSWGSWDCLS